MENIKKQIYSLPEIRRITKPLWSAWAITAVGALCGILALTNHNLSTALASDLTCFAIVGGMSLILTICFYLFGDSRRPYHKILHKTLEPTLDYYALAEQQHLINALENKDEKALSAIKRTSQSELALMRYSDKEETIFYSQLLRVINSKTMEPLTDLYIYNLNN